MQTQRAATLPSRAATVGSQGGDSFRRGRTRPWVISQATHPPKGLTSLAVTVRRVWVTAEFMAVRAGTVLVRRATASEALGVYLSCF